jgi:hypothetical protein
MWTIFIQVYFFQNFFHVTPKIKTLRTRRFGRSFFLPQVLLLKILLFPTGDIGVVVEFVWNCYQFLLYVCVVI